MTLLTSPKELVSKEAREVVGVAADGVARIVLRIPVTQAGQDVKVEVCGDKEDEATCGKMPVDEYGGMTLLPTLVSAKSFASNVVAKAGPVEGAEQHAFAVYRSPLDFTRKAAAGATGATTPGCPPGYDRSDCEAASRSVFLRISYGTDQKRWQEVKIVRPPVFLIHGLTSNPKTWDTFKPLVGSVSPYLMTRADYQFPVQIDRKPSQQGLMLDMKPTYEDVNGKLNSNALGIEWNANLITGQLRKSMMLFRSGQSVATGVDCHLNYAHRAIRPA